MQCTKESKTIVEQAQLIIPGFEEMCHKLEQNFVVNGKSRSTLNNYTRCLAHLALHIHERERAAWPRTDRNYATIFACCQHRQKAKIQSDGYFVQPVKWAPSTKWQIYCSTMRKCWMGGAPTHGKAGHCTQSASAGLRKKKADVSKEVYDRLFSKNWVVFSKQAFGTPNSVVEYLGRYSHKIAITNSRIVDIDNQKDTVTISYKNYRNGGKKQLLTLTQKEFVRRFSMYILPKEFTRIRHYGILSGTWKKKHLEQLQEKLNTSNRPKPKETKLHQCPYCKKGKLEPICVFPKKQTTTQYSRANKNT